MSMINDYHASVTQVMLAKNLGVHRGLVNGSRGVVVGFEPGTKGSCQSIDCCLDITKRHSYYLVTYHDSCSARRSDSPGALFCSK